MSITSLKRLSGHPTSNYLEIMLDSLNYPNKEFKKFFKNKVPDHTPRSSDLVSLSGFQKSLFLFIDLFLITYSITLVYVPYKVITVSPVTIYHYIMLVALFPTLYITSP